MSEMKKYWLEFDFPILVGDKIKTSHLKQKLEGTPRDAKEHLQILKKYGNMKNIKLRIRK